MILYFADRDFTVMGQASTSIRAGYTITDDTRKEAVDTAVASLDATITYTDSGRLKLESMCKAGNYLLAYDGDKEPAQTACYMIVTTEQSVTDRELTVYAEDSGLDLLNNLARAYKGNATMTAGDYVKVFLDGTGFELLEDDTTASAKACEWTDTETVSKRLLDVCDKFGAELRYGFDVNGMAVTRRWVTLSDAVGEEKNVNLYINHEVNDITVKGSVENLATALMATGKDSVTLKGFNVPSSDASRYEIDPEGNLVDKVALEKWHRADGETGNLYQKFSDTNITNQADLYNAAKEKLESLSDVATNYEVDIADLPDGVGLGDRINIIDDVGELYISGRILELETSVTSGKVKATLGEYIQESSGISDTVTRLAQQFAELSKVRELYTWIVYADNENGDGITTDPTEKDYMGTATNKTTEEPVLDASLYKWSRTKGDPGEDGATGPQGPQGDKGDKGDDGVSPVVTLETKSGSTAIKVTDAEGTKETELIDGTARADASAASDKATLANSTAETAKNTADNAGKLATAAKSTADSASSTASNALESAATANTTAEAAKSTADKAQSDINATKQHFYYDDDGAHVIGEAGGYRADITNNGLHVVDAVSGLTVAEFDSDGMRLKKDGEAITLDIDKNRIAGYRNGRLSFTMGEADEVVYNGGKYHIIRRIIPYAMYDDDGPQPLNKYSVVKPEYWEETGKLWVALTPKGSQFGYSQTRYYCVPPKYILFNDYTIDPTTGEIVSNIYYTNELETLAKNNNIVLIMEYLAPTTSQQNAFIVYNQQPLPIEDRAGLEGNKVQEFPCLVASDKYVDTPELNGSANLANATINALKAWEVTIPKDGFPATVIDTGGATLGGVLTQVLSDMQVKKNLDITGDLKKNGLNYTTIQSGTGKMTLTTGTVSDQPTWHMIGNIVELHAHVACAGAVASGSNIAAGKITGVPKPLAGSPGVRGCSYYGDNANISYMGADGTFYARNCGKDSLAKGNDARLDVTYLTDGTML